MECDGWMGVCTVLLYKEPGQTVTAMYAMPVTKKTIARAAAPAVLLILLLLLIVMMKIGVPCLAHLSPSAVFPPSPHGPFYPRFFCFLPFDFDFDFDLPPLAPLLDFAKLIPVRQVLAATVQFTLPPSPSLFRALLLPFPSHPPRKGKRRRTLHPLLPPPPRIRAVIRLLDLLTKQPQLPIRGSMEINPTLEHLQLFLVQCVPPHELH